MRNAKRAVENANFFLTQMNKSFSPSVQPAESFVVPSIQITAAGDFLSKDSESEPVAKRARSSEQIAIQPTNYNQTMAHEVLTTCDETVSESFKRSFEIYHCNLNGFITNAVRVVVAIRKLASIPHVVFLNETMTDEANRVFHLEGYVKVYRGNRSKGGRGIAVFARADAATRVTLVFDESPDERCWITIHSDDGPFLACCWYRPPKQGAIASITRFKAEFTTLRSTGISTIIVGDINVHSVRW